MIRSTLLTWWHLVLALIAITAFLSPLLTPPTNDNPTGNAGLFAPVIALCTAAVALTQAVKTRSSKFQRIPTIFIGVGSMASAYLWIAAEASAHPANPILPITLLILLAAAAVSTIVIPLLTLGDKPSKSTTRPAENTTNDETQ